ncbi:MAG: hypothetical protein IJ180_00140 [Bacteroidales bacterium]|nr:hypothetical protein [Bacteroidales bacterium]
MIKKNLFILTKILFLSLVFFASGVQCQNAYKTFHFQNFEREYLLHLPLDYDSLDNVPVLFFLHGLGGNIVEFDKELNLQKFSDEHRWIVVVPQALEAKEKFLWQTFDLGSMWNAGMEVSVLGVKIKHNKHIDDVGFLMSLLDSLSSEYKIDTDSIFFAGFSMGGFMCHRLAIECSDRINACAVISGLIAKTLAKQSPKGKLNLLQIHGTEDKIVSSLGKTSMIRPLRNLRIGISLDKTMNYWKQNLDCENEEKVDTLLDRKNDGLRFVKHSARNKTDNTKLQFLEVIGGEHKIYLDNNLYDIDYLDEIYHFFHGE